MHDLLRNGRIQALSIAAVSFITFIGVAAMGVQLFERVAPFGARLMKLAVQRPYGVAVAVCSAVAVMYVAIAVLAMIQQRALADAGRASRVTLPNVEDN